MMIHRFNYCLSFFFLVASRIWLKKWNNADPFLLTCNRNLVRNVDDTT